MSAQSARRQTAGQSALPRYAVWPGPRAGVLGQTMRGRAASRRGASQQRAQLAAVVLVAARLSGERAGVFGGRDSAIRSPAPSQHSQLASAIRHPPLPSPRPPTTRLCLPLCLSASLPLCLSRLALTDSTPRRAPEPESACLPACLLVCLSSARRGSLVSPRLVSSRRLRPVDLPFGLLLLPPPASYTSSSHLALHQTTRRAHAHASPAHLCLLHCDSRLLHIQRARLVQLANRAPAHRHLARPVA